MSKSKRLINTVCVSAAAAMLIAITVISSNTAADSPKNDSPKYQTAENYSQAEQIFADIYSGNFVSAGEKLEIVSQNSQAKYLSNLKKLLNDYNRMQQSRDDKRVEKYMECMEKLERARKEGIPEYKGFEKNKSSDNDDESGDDDEDGEDDPADEDEEDKELTFANLQANIIMAYKYAAEDTKEELLEDPIVKEVLELSRQYSEIHEQNGEWIDAYAVYYYWLPELFPDEEQYEEYGEELSNKALISTLLKDTPCETREERYSGIEPAMFVRAVKALEQVYITTMDFREMAVKGIERCKMLAEVLNFEDEDITISIDKAQIARWSVRLDEISNEVNSLQFSYDCNSMIETFGKVLESNMQTAQIPQQVVIARFTEAALNTLDPYTTLVWPWEVQEFQKNMTQKFSGIGVEISMDTGKIKINSLIPDTPAYATGLDAGDYIVKINGETTENMTINCAVKYITGPSGTEVTLTIEDGKTRKKRDVTITRKTIDVPTVRGWQREDNGNWNYMIEPETGIGYIRLTGFTSNTAEGMKEAIELIDQNGMEAIILDLRGNPGGYLQTAGDIVDYFVDEGTIVSTRPRVGFPDKLTADKKANITCPLVVLIDGGSASASEIVSGALQDPVYRRAVIVGEQSYGKGSVQTIMDYPGGGAQLKYTMAYYYLPSNTKVKNRFEAEKQNTKDWGIIPDVQIELKGFEFEDYFETQKDNNVLVQAGKDHSEIKRRSEEETIKSDPQLAAGIVVAKTLLTEKEAGFDVLAKQVQKPEKKKSFLKYLLGG
ncbi:Carboxy-terminal processing protease CtpB precursor [Limihaloglobus sulfuriphilus]|uniref:Carboxy-terminal processing protease CtpB n=1 Tax=Limihaloglobus sulfuriphilus TaxID=1851148 RepID=A0A1Q2MC88_9BACT|nr:S41 family peptidase [Limihaloglobus sulfuriphilus]AQQ70284.1 Carboxy-terminal processing protease CtpB precursor [Limihaloglobus sulfuriphilus]